MQRSQYVAIVVSAVILAGCGGTRSGHTYGMQALVSAARVRGIFARHGLRPRLVFDSRTANESDIDRLVPPTGGEGAAITRAGLLRLVAERNTHPVTLLSYSLPQVFVWQSKPDAESWARQWHERLAQGGTHVRRIDNVGVLIPESAQAESKALKAALGELASLK